MKIKLDGNSIYDCAGVRLFPGVNVVSDADVKKMQKVKAFNIRVESGLIELEEVKKLTVKDVKDMGNRDTLQAVADDESNTKQVRDAAIKRIDELTPKPAPEQE
ncbi:MAG: hypothetical protein IBX55_14000 [Methyloprofundus sp.]|nr:hypothetical protein [Methyloprofundus sp.]